MASITARRNKEGKLTSYTIRVLMGTDTEGKQIRENITFPVEPQWTEKYAHKQAEKFASIKEKEIQERTDTNSRQRFDTYFDYVLELKKSSGAKLSTIERYAGMKDRLLPAFGHLKLKEISAKKINAFYMFLLNEDTNRTTGKPLSPRTIKHYHELISAILEQAYKEGLVVSNEAHRASVPKYEIKEPAILEPEQIGTMLQVLEEEPIKWKALITVLLNSGIRRGEALGLKWDHVDFNNNMIRIDNNVLQSKQSGLYEDTPKTKTSIRSIEMPVSAMRVLKDYQVWQMEERIRLGQYFINQNFVFTQDNGNPMSPDSVSHYCRVLLSKKCGFRINPHMFRHTQASLLISEGLPVTSVSKRLGHAQISTTLNVYSHALENADKANAGALERMIYHAQEK